nr:MAG TPA: hypothetical protein [Caudoviricetes sp.]
MIYVICNPYIILVIDLGSLLFYIDYMRTY